MAATRIKIVIGAVLALFVFAGKLSASHTLNANQQRVINFWLQHHPEYRLATDNDCQCVDAIRRMRQGYGGIYKPVPDYHPYMVSGDFNGDGVLDFAVFVVNRRTRKFKLLVFNGPFSYADVSPAFASEDGGFDARQAFFYGPPRPKPYRLLIGPFESDNSVLLIPNGQTYKYDYGNEDGE
jgi:hypothetical protein